MEIIKLNGTSDNSFLREEPFLDPLTNAPGDKFNAYIYPGDEIVLYHKVSLPDDVNAAISGSLVISDIKFVSAKASLIALKPGVFSEEFNDVFLSSRKFELDSFQTAFNNANANLQLWGADGYAPNIHLQQDRPWKLPSGDFRRQVKFFTDHTSSTPTWTYYFYFPILFRWEYWLSLLTANIDFFNLSDPQNGQNQWWFHYFTSAWKIYSRLEINVLINGVPKIIRTDLNLTPGRGDVNDYAQNTDWDNGKTILTGEIGGGASNSPAVIFSNKNTEVLAYFPKTTPFVGTDADNISSVIWIEPLEGAGRSARTRASSIYPITPESVFMGLNVSATDDDGIGILDESGKYVVYDSAGAGVIVLSKAQNPSDARFFAMIDYTKLATVYPGVINFTIYARLYNSNLESGGTYDGQTLQGEELRQDAVLIGSSVISSIFTDTNCKPLSPPCPFSLDVFADRLGTDELKNDKSDFLAWGDASIASMEIVLTKLNRCGDRTEDSNYNYLEDVVAGSGATLNGLCSDDLHRIMWASNSPSPPSLGDYFSFGDALDFSGNNFEDDYGKKYIGMLLKWYKVLNAFGEGRYQVVMYYTDIFGNETYTCDPRIFCLREYNCNFADRTFRIETINEGLRGSLFDNAVLIDYAAGWYGQLRLKGVMKYKSSSYVKEYNQYGDNSFNALKPIINEQVPKYSLSVRPVPGWMDFILSTNVLQADKIMITDYNIKNRHENTFIKTPVMNDGDYTPRDNNFQNLLSDVEISLAYGQNNLRKRNSQ